MKAPAALPFYLYDFGAIRPDSFLQGDSFKLLEGVQTETVDMVFIDPPYFIKKAEWDTFENQQEYNNFMARAFWEAERILKPNGTLAFWHNDLQQEPKSRKTDGFMAIRWKALSNRPENWKLHLTANRSFGLRPALKRWTCAKAQPC